MGDSRQKHTHSCLFIHFEKSCKSIFKELTILLVLDQLSKMVYYIPQSITAVKVNQSHINRLEW